MKFLRITNSAKRLLKKSAFCGIGELLSAAKFFKLTAIAASFASISTGYQYKSYGTDKTTGLVTTLTNSISGSDGTNVANYSYEYDNNGRITRIIGASTVTNLNGTTEYIYDEAGQLVRTNTVGGLTVTYAYDANGNITARKKYSYTAGELSNVTAISTDTWRYPTPPTTGTDDNVWDDKLSSYNNQTITYDAIGNPTTYLGATLVWRGRELQSYTKGTKQIAYNYDVDGMRYKKTVKVNNAVTEVYDYVYSDGQLLAITHTASGVSNSARFIYDSTGEIRGFILNDTDTYMYLKNLQGDITALVDESGEIILAYSYDSWGRVTFSATSMANIATALTLSKVNPFTYRGYCYDYDIELYYLQSRYYDPNICRFINADSTDYLGASGGFISYNLFAYCENDAVNCVDAAGTWGEDVHKGYYGKKKESKYIKTLYRSIKYAYDNVDGVYLPYYQGRNKPIYYGTYYWAISVGINANNAKKISDFCNDVDRKFSPILADHQSWHFNTNTNDASDSRKIKSFWMCLDAMYCFETALKYKKGSKMYKSYIVSGLENLGYALHPIQDLYAHTDDRCYRSLVPKIVYLKNTNGQVETHTIFVMGWSHARIVNDITDVVCLRYQQMIKAKNETLNILKTFYENYKSLLSTKCW